jgi:hypothetical protein
VQASFVLFQSKDITRARSAVVLALELAVFRLLPPSAPFLLGVHG